MALRSTLGSPSSGLVPEAWWTAPPPPLPPSRCGVAVCECKGGKGGKKKIRGFVGKSARISCQQVQIVFGSNVAGVFEGVSAQTGCQFVQIGFVEQYGASVGSCVWEAVRKPSPKGRIRQ
jgi:hypothetical protein